MEGLNNPIRKEGDNVLPENLDSSLDDTVRHMLTENKPVTVQIVADRVINVVAERSWGTRALVPSMVHREGTGDIEKGTIIPKETSGGYSNSMYGSNDTVGTFVQSINEAPANVNVEQRQFLDFLENERFIEKDHEGKYQPLPGQAEVAIQGAF